MRGESCSLGGDECSMNLMVVQRHLGFLEALLMRSRLDVANDVIINLFADEVLSKQPDRQGGQARHWKPSIAACAYVFVS